MSFNTDLLLFLLPTAQDGNGIINAEELHDLVSALEHPISMEEAEQVRIFALFLWPAPYPNERVAVSTCSDVAS